MRMHTFAALLLGSAAVAAALPAGRVVRSESVAPGLAFFEWRSEAPPVALPWSVIAGVDREQKLADARLVRVEAAGFRALPVSTRAGYEVRVPGFASRQEAERALARLQVSGLEGAEVRETGQDLAIPGGPFVAQILEVDPGLVEVRVAHARDAAMGLETTRDLARRHDALAAVNGGFFRVAGPFAGESEGILVVDGQLLSEPDRGRAGFAIVRDGLGGRAAFDRLGYCGELTFPEGSIVSVDGVNRERRPGEVIVYTPEFHLTTLTSPGGIEIVQGPNGVEQIRRGLGSSSIPEAGHVISLAPGVDLPEALLPGQTIGLELTLAPKAPDPERLWARARGALGAGPLLLRDGEIALRPELESISRVFSEARHPRTAAAARADGTLLFVTVDGRRPGWSAGVSLPELIELLLELGATDAVNLDGGGSTAMVVRGETVNRPSDDGGERANGDAILLFAR